MEGEKVSTSPPPESVDEVPAELLAIAEKIKHDSQAQGRTYDCVIGASGGLDSTFVLYVTRCLLNLNPFVLCYDNGFRHTCAMDNLKRACEQLECELRIIPPLENDRKYIYYATKAALNLGIYYGPCFSCNYLLPTLAYQAAMQERAPVFANTDPVESEMEKRSHGPIGRAILRAFVMRGPLNAISFLYNSLAAQRYLVKTKFHYDGFSLRTLITVFNVFFNPRPPRGCEVVRFTDLITWDCFAIERIIREKLGWKCPRGDTKVPHLRFDCGLVSVKNAALLKTMGETFQAMYCNWWVENGYVTKEEAAADYQYFNDRERNQKEVDETLKQILEQSTGTDAQG